MFILNIYKAKRAICAELCVLTRLNIRQNKLPLKR
jgi:hypothetical protein